MKVKKNNLTKSSSLFLLIVLFILLVNCFFILVSCSENKDITLPDYSGFVNDYTGTISKEWLDKTEIQVRNVEQETKCEIGVAVINSLNGNSIEDYAVKLFEKWGIGKENENNGVLLLVSMKEKELRIEVGYGLEGVVTDIEAGNIINAIIVPRFREENYEAGIYNGVIAISNEINSEYGRELSSYSSDYASVTKVSFSETKAFENMMVSIVVGANVLPWLILGLIIGIPVIRFNIRKRKCPNCKKLKLKIWQKILEKPTFISSGRTEETRLCSFCGFSDVNIKIIPPLQKYKSGGGGSSSHSWSSFSSSGGSHGSSSGGFGGGSSGGGGASGRW